MNNKGKFKNQLHYKHQYGQSTYLLSTKGFHEIRGRHGLVGILSE